MLLCKHVFPNLPQRLFPSTRRDGVLVQAIHFTQIPSDQPTNVVMTRLAHDFQISLHCEHGYDLHKMEAVALVKDQLDAIHVTLNNKVITPISVTMHPIHKNGRALQKLACEAWKSTLWPCSKAIIELLPFRQMVTQWSRSPGAKPTRREYIFNTVASPRLNGATNLANRHAYQQSPIDIKSCMREP